MGELPLTIDDLDYVLPPGRIAQEPAERRDAARLLVVRRGAPGTRHATVAELPELLPPRTLLVVNDTRVLPARLLGTRQSTGGKAEVLLVRRLERHGARAERWSALLRTRGKPRPAERFALGTVCATYAGRLPGGAFVFDLAPTDPRETVDAAIQRGGVMPLPPYIRRPPTAADGERYQTVYAARPGAVAAPTAGLHFTTGLLERIRAAGHELVRITLHVGPGTFRPIDAGRPEEHVLEPEWAELSAAAAAAIDDARRAGRIVLAVGTTVVRTLETAAGGGRPGAAEPPDDDPAAGAVAPFAGETGTYILPGHRFRAVDALLTNFHLPRTTLLALVMAFHGIAPTRAAYAAALDAGYRFYSYGDAMLVLPEQREDGRIRTAGFSPREPPGGPAP